MRQQGTRDLFKYWNGLRQGRAAPERAEIDPAAIRHILADTFMLEVDAGGAFPFRLSGTRINALFDVELKGRSFADLWRTKEAENMAALLLNVADTACPVLANVAAAPAGYAPAELELLLLPLRHPGKRRGRILGLMTCSEQPSWLGLLPVQRLVLRGLRIITSEPTSLKAPSRLSAASKIRPIPTALPARMPPPAARFSTFEQRRHLRIYPGGRQDGQNPI